MNNYNQHRLNRQDYKTLILAALGGALEFYDFIIFVFLADIIGELFFPSDMPIWLRMMQVFGIFAAGYLVRPLGGIVMAHAGDRRGRKNMFTLSVLLMTLPTLAIAVLPTYPTVGIAAPLLLLLLRLLQGAAVGGEVPGAWVFVAEHVPFERSGLACGILTAGLSAGILFGSVVVMLLHTLLSHEAILGGGWRLPFLLGGVTGLVAMFLRRWLQETPVFIALRARSLMQQHPLRMVLLHHRDGVVLSVLLTWLLSAGIVVVILMAPTLLQHAGIAPTQALRANGLAILMLAVGCISAGLATDRFGAGITLVTGSLLMAGCCWLFWQSVTAYPERLFIVYALAGFSTGVVGAVPYVMVHAFPANVRFSGVSFSYNMSYAIFGGCTPLAVMFLMRFTPAAPGYYVLALSCVGVLAGGFLWWRASENMQLD